MTYSYRNTHTFTKSTDLVDQYYGWAVDFNQDGTRIAIGSVRADNSGNAPNGTSEQNPSVEIFEYDGISWNKIGAIHQDTSSNTEFDSSQLGMSVSFNSSGSIIAVGSGNVNKGGSVYVFEETRPNTGIINSIHNDPYGNARWTLRDEIHNTSFNTDVGFHRQKSVQLNHDATTMLIKDNSHNYLYTYNGDIWSEKVILSPSTGLSSMNKLGTTIAIGDSTNDKVDVYYSHNNWSTNISRTIQSSSSNSNFGKSVSLNYNGDLLAVGMPNYRPDGDGSPISGAVKVFYKTNSNTWTESFDTSYGSNTEEYINHKSMGHRVHLTTNEDLNKLVIANYSVSNYSLQVMHSIDPSGADFYVKPIGETMINSINTVERNFCSAINTQGTILSNSLINKNEIYIYEYTTPLEWQTPVIYDVLSQTAHRRDFSNVALAATEFGKDIETDLSNTYLNEPTYMYWNSPNCNSHSIHNVLNPILFQYTYYASQSIDASLNIACDNRVTMYINNSPTSIVNHGYNGTSIDILFVQDTTYVFDFYCWNLGGPAFFSILVNDGSNVLFNTSKSTNGWKWKWTNRGLFSKDIPLIGLYGGETFRDEPIDHNSGYTGYDASGDICDLTKFNVLDTVFDERKKIPDVGFRFDYSGVSHDFSEVFKGYYKEASIIFDFDTIYNSGNSIYNDPNAPEPIDGSSNDVSLQSRGALDDTFAFACKNEIIVDGSLNISSTASILFWMKTSGTSTNNLVYIPYSQGINNASGYISISHHGYGLKITIKANSVITDYSNNTINGTNISNVVLNDEKWHHVCVSLTCKSIKRISEMSIFIDGEYVTSFFNDSQGFIAESTIGETGTTFLKTSPSPSAAEIALFKLFTDGHASSYMLTPQQIKLIYQDENPTNRLSSKKAYIPVVDGIVRLFVAEPSTYTTSWHDLTDTNNAILSGRINVGYNHSDVYGLSTYGANSTFSYLYGDVSSSVTVPITTMTDGSFTVFHISRYHNESTGHHSEGGNRGRIWDGSDNWVSGHHYNSTQIVNANNYNINNDVGPQIGIVNSNGAITKGLRDSNGNLLDEYWILSTDIGTTYKRTYIHPTTGEQSSDEFDGTAGRSSHTLIDQLSINNGVYSDDQSSDWACAFMAIYNRQLSESERISVENYLFDKYFQPVIVPTKKAMEHSALRYTPITQGLTGLFVAEESETYTSSWMSKTLSKGAVIGGTGAVDVSTNNVGEFGSDISFSYIYGDQTTTLDICNNWPGSEYTFIHITRYTNSDYPDKRQRIWSSVSGELNWYSGFHRHDIAGQPGTNYGGRGIFYQGPVGYDEKYHLNSVTQGSVTDWILIIDQPKYAKIKDTLIDLSFSNNECTTDNLNSIQINKWPNETSEWACGFAAVYNRILPESELLTIQNYLYDKYFVNIPEPSYYWEFRVKSGNLVTDYIDSSIIATTYENAYYNDVSGLVLDGSNDYVDITTFELGGVLSIESYFSMDLTGTDSQRIIDFGDRQGTPNEEDEYNVSNSLVVGRYDDNSGTQLYYNNSTATHYHQVFENNINTNTVYHMVNTIQLIENDIHLNTYINGTKQNEKTETSGNLPDIVTRSKHYIGKNNWNDNEFFKGSISYVRLWKGHALTQYQVNELYRQRNNKTYYPSTVTPIEYVVSVDSDYFSTNYIFKASGQTIDVPTLTKGSIYKFIYEYESHPFHIGSSRGVNDLFFITSNGTGTEVSGTYSYKSLIGIDEFLMFKIPHDFEGTINYHCLSHESMSGTFNVRN